MKKVKLFNSGLALVFLTVVLTSCLPNTLLEPEPAEGSIIRFKITNVEGSIVSLFGQNINVSLPIGSPTTELIPEIIVSKGTTVLDYTEGQPMDLSQDVIIKVRGTDNVIVEYLVKTAVRQPQPGFASIELQFERKHTSDYGWNIHQQYSSATSGEDVLVANANVIQILDGTNGEPKGVLSGHPGSIHQITNDDAGRIIAVNVLTTASTFKIYKWENVNSSAPEVIVDFPIPAADWPVTSGNLGRCLLSVTGDLSKDAVITIPMARSNFFYRWTFTNGQLVSNTPEKVVYSFPLSIKTFGNITVNINNLGPTPQDGYIVTHKDRGWEYLGRDEQYTFSAADGMVPTRSFVFDFNNAKYYVGAVTSPNTSFYIFDITKPKGIEMSEADRFDEGIDFKPFQSTVFGVEGPANTTPHLGFSFRQHEDGTATLYYLYANSGLRAYKLTPKHN